jgi:hypothetical protein
VSPASAVGGVTEDSTPSEGGSARGEASGTTMRLAHQATPTSGRWSSALLTAKIAVPQPPPGLVLHPRLTNRLSDAVASRVTLVSAGPGWGKTMLVAGLGGDSLLVPAGCLVVAGLFRQRPVSVLDLRGGGGQRHR